MNAVDRIKMLCRKRDIPLYKVERELGFSNGYIGSLKKGTLPSDRVNKLAEYFGVTAEWIMTGSDTREDIPAYYLDDDAREFARFIHSNPEYKTLFDATRRVKPEDIDFVVEVIERLEK